MLLCLFVLEQAHDVNSSSTETFLQIISVLVLGRPFLGQSAGYQEEKISLLIWIASTQIKAGHDVCFRNPSAGG